MKLPLQKYRFNMNQGFYVPEGYFYVIARYELQITITIAIQHFII